MIHAFVFLPFLASLFLPLMDDLRFKRWWAAGAALLTFALGVGLWMQGEVNVSLPWLPQLGMTYSVGLGGVSTLLAMVTAFMTLVAVIYAGWRVEKPGTMLWLVLVMETGLLGIFAARDLMLFYIFFEATLIPSLLLLAFYGKAQRLKALFRFAVYTIVGSLLLLLSIIAVLGMGGSPSFAWSDLMQHPLPDAAQRLLFWGFLAAFAVKLPLVPVHGWLADFHEQNHDSGVADLMGTLYKVGGYGLFFWTLPLFPVAMKEFQVPLMVIAATTALYSAWIAFNQTHWKRLLAFAGLSHMGMVGLGIFSLNATAMTGSMYLLAFQGVYMGALFLVLGMLYKRDTQGQEHADLAHRVGQGGWMDQLPVLSGVTMVLWFAAIGVPGLAGFIGEFSILFGSYQVSPWIAFVAGISTIAAAAYALTAYQKTFWEKPQSGRVLSNVLDLSFVESLVVWPCVAVLLCFGVYSAPALELIQPAVKTLVGFLGGVQ